MLQATFSSEPHSAALSYGKENEHKAVDAYILHKKTQGIDVVVESVGMILSKDRPGFGASLDGIVSDSSADIIKGGLEVKCPISKLNMTVDKACSDNTFYLTQAMNGTISLKKNANYFYQVLGQMYIAELKWVDFVVWFGPENDIFVQRIYFDSELWFKSCLPKLDLFYKWEIVPELLTRRVQRKIQLISRTHWKYLISN